MENFKDTGTPTFYTEDILGEEIFAECGGEFLLPDYLPEVRRILSVSARALPEGHFLAENAEFAGQTVFTLLYTDDGGKLCATTLRSPYEVSLPLSEPHDGVLTVKERAEEVGVRLLGPRRLTLRTRVRILPHLYIKREIPGELGEESLVTLTRNVKDGEYVNQSLQDLPIEAHLPLAAAEGERKILFADGTALLRECRPERDGVRVRGDILFSAMVSGDGLPELAETRQSFDEWIPLENAADYLLTADTKLGEVEATLDEQRGELSLSAPLSLFAEGRRALTLPVVCDAFSTEHPTRAECERFPFSAPIDVETRRIELSGSIPTEEEGTVLFTHCRPLSVATARQENEVVLDGMLEVTCLLALCSNEEGNIRYTSVTGTLPFRHRADWQRDCCTVKERLGALRMTGRCDRGKIELTGDLALTLFAEEQSEESLPVALHPTEGGESLPRDAITVYYTQGGDTLWSVAKNFRIPPADIAAANDLPDEVLSEPDSAVSLDGMPYLLLGF